MRDNYLKCCLYVAQDAQMKTILWENMQEKCSCRVCIDDENDAWLHLVCHWEDVASTYVFIREKKTDQIFCVNLKGAGRIPKAFASNVLFFRRSVSFRMSFLVRHRRRSKSFSLFYSSFFCSCRWKWNGEQKIRSEKNGFIARSRWVCEFRHVTSAPHQWMESFFFYFIISLFWHISLSRASRVIRGVECSERVIVYPSRRRILGSKREYDVVGRGGRSCLFSHKQNDFMFAKDEHQCRLTRGMTRERENEFLARRKINSWRYKLSQEVPSKS